MYSIYTPKALFAKKCPVLRDLIYKWFDYQKEQYQNKVHGYVIMPNHLHGLFFVSDKSPALPILIRNAKRFLAYGIVRLLQEDENQEVLNIFADRARKKNGAHYKVFEERYDSKIIESEQLYYEKLHYIHKNPCAKNWHLANTPEEYPHSSASNYLLGRGVYDVDLLV